MRTTARRIAFVVSCIVIGTAMTYGCPVCYGASETSSSSGIAMAIATLLGITGTVLSAIVAFAVRMNKRAKITLNGDVDLPSLN
ncbi:MAG: hypothetical protein HYZ01_10615 [Ignavibacteriales bacterium]|nr:hypothetical protein [Ignavibacteriales bacterium]